MDSFGVGLASILFLGIGAQWLAWRMRVPSILLLLLAGFSVGPLWEVFFGTPLIRVDSYFHEEESLLGAVSLAVAVILLEGGLSLRLADLKEAAKATRRLILFGAPITFVLTTLAAHYVLGWDWDLAALIGSILIVTGPTVIIPLLNHVRPTGTVASVVRWEGIVTDPIGAIAAVLAFKFIEGDGDAEHALIDSVQGLFVSGFVGCAVGAAGAYGFLFLMKRRLVPEFLQASLALTVGIMAFMVSDEFEKESGLVAVTFMGVLLANQKSVFIDHIVEFKENLRVLLISSLFIVLAARLPLVEVQKVEWRAFAFVAVMIFAVRPIVVFLSTIGSGLTVQEKLFVSWMAPRGIVAAAVASVFSLELAHTGTENADQLVSVTFVVIVVTVAVYGLTAKPVARWLGVARGNPQGVLIVGAHDWARGIAAALHEAGISVLLADTNRSHALATRMAGLPMHFGSVLDEDFEDRAHLDRLGHLLAMTPNDEVNSLACLQLASFFGREHVYQLPLESESEPGEGTRPSHFQGHALFSADECYFDLQSRMRGGAIVKRTKLTEEFTFEDLQVEYDAEYDGADILPLFQVSPDGKLEVADAKRPIEPRAGSTLISLICPCRGGKKKGEQAESEA